MAYISIKERLFRASRLNTNYQISTFKETKKSTPPRNASQETRDFHSSRYEKYLRAKFGAKWAEHI